MKFCPVCQTRYDEEILHFCIKDGTPLVEENPTFTEMPSQANEEEEAEDIGEETLIRRNPPAQPDDFEEEDFSDSGQRIVIPMTAEEVEAEAEKEPVRAKPAPAPRYEKPQKSNTALVVLVTMMGTLLVLGALGGIWYFLSSRNAANSNQNINVNTSAPNLNLETNTNADNSSSANFDFNANVNTNTNANVNLATPTRTPTPTPTKTPEDDVNANTNSNINLGNTNVMSRPSPSPGETPATTPTPRPSPSPETTPANVNVGIMNSRASNLVKPAYPQTAKQMNASGQVMVQISVDEDGNVLSAKAVSGNSLLRSAAENAARQSRFNPVKINDRAVRATGLVVYNFINQ